MDTMVMHWLDWLVVILFFIMVLWIGVRSGKNINNGASI